MSKLLWLLALVPVLASAQIFRWTDAEGRVHFSQQPQAGAERVELKPQVLERDQATRANEADSARFFEARRSEQAQADEQAAERREKQRQHCEKLHNALADLKRGGLFYRNDAAGERDYYSDEQVRAARHKLETAINKDCP